MRKVKVMKVKRRALKREDINATEWSRIIRTEKKKTKNWTHSQGCYE